MISLTSEIPWKGYFFMDETLLDFFKFLESQYLSFLNLSPLVNQVFLDHFLFWVLIWPYSQHCLSVSDPLWGPHEVGTHDIRVITVGLSPSAILLCRRHSTATRICTLHSVRFRIIEYFSYYFHYCHESLHILPQEK
jgi:hypothetical protein